MAAVCRGKGDRARKGKNLPSCCCDTGDAVQIPDPKTVNLSFGNPIRTPPIELTFERTDMSPTDADAVATRRNQSEDFGTVARGARTELSDILKCLETYSAGQWPDIGRAISRRETKAFMLSLNWGRRLFRLETLENERHSQIEASTGPLGP